MDAVTARRRWRLAAEFLLLFFGAVGGYAAVHPPGTPLLPLLLLTPAVLWYLAGPARLGREELVGVRRLRGALRRPVLLWAGVAVVAVATIALVDPGRLFDLPRERPLLWAAVVVAYPLLSVYPQELIFRGFLLHRYAPVLGEGRRAAAASAAAFGFAHVIYGNVWSVVLTTAGGWLFARRYQRTRSMAVVTVEHALYGVLAFTVGPADLFYDDGTGATVG